MISLVYSCDILKNQCFQSVAALALYTVRLPNGFEPLPFLQVESVERCSWQLPK